MGCFLTGFTQARLRTSHTSTETCGDSSTTSHSLLECKIGCFNFVRVLAPSWQVSDSTTGMCFCHYRYCVISIWWTSLWPHGWSTWENDVNFLWMKEQSEHMLGFDFQDHCEWWSTRTGLTMHINDRMRLHFHFVKSLTKRQVFQQGHEWHQEHENRQRRVDSKGSWFTRKQGGQIRKREETFKVKQRILQTVRVDVLRKNGSSAGGGRKGMNCRGGLQEVRQDTTDGRVSVNDVEWVRMERKCQRRHPHRWCSSVFAIIFTSSGTYRPLLVHKQPPVQRSTSSRTRECKYYSRSMFRDSTNSVSVNWNFMWWFSWWYMCSIVNFFGARVWLCPRDGKVVSR